MNLLRKYLASHKGTLLTFAGSVFFTTLAVAQKQIEAGQMPTVHQLQQIAIGAALSALLAAGKSFLTPAQDPPLPEKPVTGDSSGIGDTSDGG